MTADADLPLFGRTAVITGGAGRIGTAVCTALARAGADIALTYHSRGEQAEALAAELKTLGRRVIALPADLTSTQAGIEVIERVEEEFGRLDILVPNAGYGLPGRWTSTDHALWDRAFAINVTVPFFMTQRALPGMIERGWGRVLFLSSIAALAGGAFGPSYAASKAALHGLTHDLAPQVAASGVTVNALAPAIIGKDSVAPLGPDVASAIIGRIPVGRPGTVEEAADMALAMITNAYLTNKVIVLDGGLIPR